MHSSAPRAFAWSPERPSPCNRRTTPFRKPQHIKSAAFQRSFLYRLRHTHALLSLQNGDDFKTVQQNVTHATASFTLDVYGHVSDRMQKESAKRMQSFYNTLSEAK